MADSTGAALPDFWDARFGEYRGPLNARGVPHGRGVMTRPDGVRYEGEFRGRLANGRGVMTWPDGRRYEGEWRDGKRHGRGVETEPDGGRYEGEASAGMDSCSR